MLLSSSKHILIFFFALLALFNLSSAAESLCRRCGPDGVYYTFTSNFGSFQAFSPGAICTRTTMAQNNGALFRDQVQQMPGAHSFTVTLLANGYSKTCTGENQINTCCSIS